MKKKCLIFSLLLISLFVFTGCGKKEESTNTKVDISKKLTLTDEGYGTTTFTYGEDKDYVVKDEHSGKYMTLKVTSEKENFELELYHTSTYAGSYETGKKNRSSSDEFKEYTWNGYKGYTYNGTNTSISFNILLDSSENEEKVLFGSMEYHNSNDMHVLDTFKSDDFQKLLNSIKFEK